MGTREISAAEVALLLGSPENAVLRFAGFPAVRMREVAPGVERPFFDEREVLEWAKRSGWSVSISEDERARVREQKYLDARECDG